MPLASLDDLTALIRRGPTEAPPDAPRELLARRLAEYLPRRREPLARFEVRVDGAPQATFIHALSDDRVAFDSAEISVINPPPPGPRWEYLVPFEKLRFDTDGSVEVSGSNGGRFRPLRAIVRFMYRERFFPSAPSNDPTTHRAFPKSGLGTLGQSAKFIRDSGLVPFSAVALLYFAEQRTRIEFDLIDNLLLPDPRAGRLPVSRFVRRSSRVAHGLDAFLARGELSVAAARALEVLVESHGVTALELAGIFGGIREMANSVLETLRARQLATYERATAIYRARLDAFLAAANRASGSRDPVPLLVNPALRSSVSELLAAADSRATCPLCGDPMPSGPRAILCDKCAAEVGYASSLGT
jgi:hypothetical protein